MHLYINWIYVFSFYYLPCFSVISLSQWFVQRNIQVTRYYEMLPVSDIYLVTLIMSAWMFKRGFCTCKY